MQVFHCLGTLTGETKQSYSVGISALVTQKVEFKFGKITFYFPIFLYLLLLLLLLIN